MPTTGEDWEAYCAGCSAGENGLPLCDCPYPEGRFRQYWLDGWYIGSRIRAAANAQAARQADSDKE